MYKSRQASTLRRAIPPLSSGNKVEEACACKMLTIIIESNKYHKQEDYISNLKTRAKANLALFEIYLTLPLKNPQLCNY